MIAQRSEQFHVGQIASNSAIKASRLVAEARLGIGLVRALVQHVLRMQATGYEEEFVVDGELWHLELKRKAPVS